VNKTQLFQLGSIASEFYDQ